ncbi:HK97 gp10 family phage protein [Streptomyces sp. NBC_00101]|uniref:HK97 gp10 family phage protein n=1 Tax=Streptomyces sp. NBC_00101 TaxID=2975651 RepID=UPI003243EA5D
MTVDVELDEAAIRALVREQEVREAVRDTAERGQRFAQQIAPVVTGRYRDSIRVVEDNDGVDVVADIGYAEHLEYGTRHMPGQHILGRTLDSLRSSGQP